MTDNYARHAISIDLPNAFDLAKELGVNPKSGNMQLLDATREYGSGYYYWILIDLDDNYILFDDIKTTEQIEEFRSDYPDIIMYT